MIFPKLALLILAFTPGGNSKKLEGSDIDCSDKANHEDALCMCRYPQNYDTKTCQNLKAQDGDFFAEIINGEEVDPNVYPWFARSTLGSGWGGCGGSLITPEYVLTAAHCVDGRISQLETNGGYQIGALCAPYGPNTSNNCQQDVQSFGIDKIIPHPSYNSNTLQYDFALVRLDGSSTITPVNIDAGTVSPGYENLPLKQNLWPIGFGTTETGSVSTKLMHVNVNYVKQSQCNSAYGGSITDDMMCAADTNQDSCQGDSGGPLYDSDNDTLVGVVSWGIGCARPEYPGVYARISHQIGWIKDEICEPGAHNEPRPEFCGSTGPTEPPTTAPPTPAPTPCSANDFKLTLTTDNYPGETTWTLVNQCTNEQYAQGGPFNNAGTQYVEEFCIPDGEYTFTINDSYGDGICCSYGEGSYILEYNANIEKEGGNFGGSDSHTFGSCGAPSTAAPTTAPTAAPTRFPTASPTPAPTSAPTFAPTNAPTVAPTSTPTNAPTVAPTSAPTNAPVPTVIAPTSAPTTAPTSAPIPDNTCVDDPLGWFDIDGPYYDCEWYAQSNFCELYGDSYANNGVTANMACCACGGGRGTAPTPAPLCNDSPAGWYDIDGPTFDCEWYSQFNYCEIFGDSYENNGATANQACCACGGGDNPSPSIAGGAELSISRYTLLSLTTFDERKPSWTARAQSSYLTKKRGNWMARIRKNKSLTLENLDVPSECATIRVDFSYFTSGFEEGDKFKVEAKYNDVDKFVNEGEFVFGEDFENNVNRVVDNEVILEFPTYGQSQLTIQIRNDSNQGNDRLFLDDIKVECGVTNTESTTAVQKPQKPKPVMRA